MDALQGRQWGWCMDSETMNQCSTRPGTVPCWVTSKQTKLVLSRQWLNLQFLLLNVCQCTGLKENLNRTPWFLHLLLSNNDVLLKFPLNHSIEFLIHRFSKHLPALFARHVGIQSLHRAQSQLSWKELAGNPLGHSCHRCYQQTNSKWSTTQPGLCLKMVDTPMHCHWKVGNKKSDVIWYDIYLYLYYSVFLLGSNPL